MEDLGVIAQSLEPDVVFVRPSELAEKCQEMGRK